MSSGEQVPKTCCTQFPTAEVNNCRKDPFSTKYNLTGCFDKFQEVLDSNKNSVLIVGVIIVVIMVRMIR